MNKLFKEIVNEIPDSACEISKSLFGLKSEFVNISKEVGEASIKINTNNYDEGLRLYNIFTQINIDTKRLDEYIEALKLSDDNVENDSDKQKIKFDLAEEFTVENSWKEKIPLGFKIEDGNINKISSCEELLVETSRIFLLKDKKKFKEIKKLNTQDKIIFGTKLSRKKKLMKPRDIYDSIFIETNLNIEEIRHYITELLSIFEMDKGEFKVYLVNLE